MHIGTGSLTLDLTKPYSANPSSSSAIPLTPTQKMILAHGILCTVGFLFILPAGALLVRYVRTFSNKWFMPHAAMQFMLCKFFRITSRLLETDTWHKLGLSLSSAFRWASSPVESWERK